MVEKPDLDAKLIADSIASQLERRAGYRRAMKRAISNAMRFEREGLVEGIKVQLSGRVGGAEIARVEKYHEGRVPLHTLRAEIDYALSEAKTVFGILGIKVWVCKGESPGKSGLVVERKGRSKAEER